MGSAAGMPAARATLTIVNTSQTEPHGMSTTRLYTTSATIDDVTQEILLEIVKQLPYIPFATSYEQLLYNLCLVKVFNPAATEALYSSKFVF
jgi:hypothetical protein